MTISSIKRIGIVLKPNQPDALKTMCELTIWLSARGISLLGGPEIERQRIEEKTGVSLRECRGRGGRFRKSAVIRALP